MNSNWRFHHLGVGEGRTVATGRIEIFFISSSSLALENSPGDAAAPVLASSTVSDAQIVLISFHVHNKVNNNINGRVCAVKCQ